MIRDLKKLADEPFDLLIIGGGIYGAAAAWEASLRGLAVAVIDKGDFGSATSSNSLKIIHGGLRYLQHADLIRMRESISERRIVMRIAPHLVQPFPCLMPTYGHRIKGPEVMALAMLMNDVISLDRNRGLEPSRRLARGEIVAKETVRRLIPHVDERNLTGGALWYDAQVYNSERLLFAYLHSAADKGTCLANYVQAKKILVRDGRAIGVQAVDALTGQPFEIRSRVVVNNSGAWTDELLSGLDARPKTPAVQLSTAMNLVLRRRLTEIGAGISAKVEFKDRDAVISKGSRLFFIAPWRNISMVGTWHDPYPGRPDAFQPADQDLERMIRQVNDALPGVDLRRDEIALVHRGFLPMAGVHPESGDVRLLKHYRILDHRHDLHLEGLLSVISVKFTTARDVAVKTVNAVFRQLGLKPSPSHSHARPIDGGDIADVAAFTQDEIRQHGHNGDEAAIRHLIQNYGSRYGRIWKAADGQGRSSIAAGSSVLKAEVIHGVREEMALKLSDVVLRRTELGTVGHPGQEALTTCAQVMAAELGWSVERQQNEIKEVAAVYPA